MTVPSSSLWSLGGAVRRLSGMLRLFVRSPQGEKSTLNSLYCVWYVLPKPWLVNNPAEKTMLRNSYFQNIYSNVIEVLFANTIFHTIACKNLSLPSNIYVICWSTALRVSSRLTDYFIWRKMNFIVRLVRCFLRACNGYSWTKVMIEKIALILNMSMSLYEM